MCLLASLTSPLSHCAELRHDVVILMQGWDGTQKGIYKMDLTSLNVETVVDPFSDGFTEGPGSDAAMSEPYGLAMSFNNSLLYVGVSRRFLCVSWSC